MQLTSPERALSCICGERSITASLISVDAVDDVRRELGKPSADTARMAVTRAVNRLAAEMRRAH
jgi:hypothetical protein